MFRDTRELAFQQLQSVLAAKDFELAQSQQVLSELTSEIADLRKIKQREGINMDYLKNVVFQVRLICHSNTSTNFVDVFLLSPTST